jgi:FtsP/CotA-like multicopper oxidase with cupredoxin domain
MLLAAASYLAGGTPPVQAAHADMPAVGMVCTESLSGTFTLTTKTGTIILPDGNVLYMWGFSEGNRPFQHPSPVLCVNEGDEVTVVLNNTLPEPVSIVFPGQKDVLANGKPVTPQYVGEKLVSLVDTAPSGGSITYSFTAGEPGTYLYESGTDSAKQINMGLFGAFVVRPSSNVYDAQGNLVEAYSYNHPDSQYKPGHEFLILLSEIDPDLHVAVEQGLPYNLNNYRPRYWMINGRSFPDTIAPNGAPWLPNQPYSSLALIQPQDETGTPETNPGYNPYPAMIRYLNAGMESYPFHAHGNHARLIAHDGNLLRGPIDEDLSYEKFSIVIGPGQTADGLFSWRDAENWDPVDNPIPVEIPQLQNLVYGTFYSGSPYLGNLSTLPVGMQALNQCGEYYHIAHSHALQQITAWGMVLSGHITFTRIDPPDGPDNLCP